MTDVQKFVLMIQPNRLQGFIWRSILKSQNISVIWESPDTDLRDNLTQIKQAGLTLPHLLLLDRQCLGDNPYEFCRWCRTCYPEVKIILTQNIQRDISDPERDWTIQQGAADLLPGFQRDNLVSSASAGVKRVLDVLGEDYLNDGALITVLLKLRRELEARQERRDRRPIETNAEEVDFVSGLGYDSDHVASADLEMEFSTTPVRSNNQAAASPARQANGASAAPPQPQKPARRYRGISY
ncbi:MAG: hypothetical protein WBA57_23970 [Elainellaceae cyanobacterium]